MGEISSSSTIGIENRLGPLHPAKSSEPETWRQSKQVRFANQKKPLRHSKEISERGRKRPINLNGKYDPTVSLQWCLRIWAKLQIEQWAFGQLLGGRLQVWCRDVVTPSCCKNQVNVTPSRWEILKSRLISVKVGNMLQFAVLTIPKATLLPHRCLTFIKWMNECWVMLGIKFQFACRMNERNCRPTKAINTVGA